jgi:hypothetical protein
LLDVPQAREDGVSCGTIPAKKHIPRTRRMLLNIEPIRLDCTTWSSHLPRVSKRTSVSWMKHLRPIWCDIGPPRVGGSQHTHLIKARMETINSTALPRVALRRPPIV